MVTKQNQDLTLVIDNKAEKVTAQVGQWRLKSPSGKLALPVPFPFTGLLELHFGRGYQEFCHFGCGCLEKRGNWKEYL